MNFFERQHQARNASVRLVVLFTLAVLSIVAATDALTAILLRQGPTSTIISGVIAATIVTLLIIGGGTASKMIALRAGGAAVATSVGAVPIDPSTQDPRLRQFVNIVEEMSIASGVPAPRLFVLEREQSINAFAAGYSPADAAITATAGSLEQLNRDELQGVIGHEFSHILNGDMRMNVRLIGLLNGILLLGLVGLRFLQFGGGRGRGGKDGNPLLVLAIAAIVLGFVGSFFAGLIKAGVSRQREWLADASSVQFTRQTVGLAGALKKIAVLPDGSVLNDTHAEKQINHMLFGEGSRGISQLYATHPPLLERIKALEPSFTPAELSDLQESLARDADAATPSSRPAPASPPVSTRPLVASAIAALVGTFSAADLTHGAALSSQIPAPVRQAATQPSTVVPLLFALLLDSDAGIRTQQLNLLAAGLGQAAATAAAAAVELTDPLPEILRLPLVDIAAPMLLARPPEQLAQITKALDALVAADNSMSLFEYCLTRLIHCYTLDAGDPLRRSRVGSGALKDAKAPALLLLTAIAAAGNADPAAAQHAFGAGAITLFPSQLTPPYSPPADFAQALDGGWPVLDALAPGDKQRLVQAVVTAISDDNVVAPAEAELLRVTCALLHCPLPALLG